MTLFLRLLTALEIILTLKKLREQSREIANSNFSSSSSYQHEVPKERQAAENGHAQIGKKQ
jgi:hypothetical protein